jgi:hypothetical protein
MKLPFGMASPRQGLPVRLDRAPQRGAAFAIKQGLKAPSHALNRFALARKRFIAHCSTFPSPSLLRRLLVLLITLSPTANGGDESRTTSANATRGRYIRRSRG